MPRSYLTIDITDGAKKVIRSFSVSEVRMYHYLRGMIRSNQNEIMNSHKVKPFEEALTNTAIDLLGVMNLQVEIETVGKSRNVRVTFDVAFEEDINNIVEDIV